MSPTIINFVTALLCASSAIRVQGAAIARRQTNDAEAQLAAQAAQLSSMNAPKLAADAAFIASGAAVISSQHASQLSLQASVVAAHSASDDAWLAAQIAIISAQAASMGIPYTVPGYVAANPTGPPSSDDEDDCESDDGTGTTQPGSYATASIPAPTTSANIVQAVADQPEPTISAGPSVDPDSSQQQPTADGGASLTLSLETKRNSYQQAPPSPSPSDTFVAAGVGSSSQPPAVPSTSAPAVAPATTAAAPATSAPATSAPATGGGGGSGGNACQNYSPDGTCSALEISWYNTYDHPGACGSVLHDSMAVFAFNSAGFDKETPGGYPNGNPNNNPLCGKKIKIKAADGTFIEATLADRCPAEGCNGVSRAIDITPSLFSSLVARDPQVTNGMGVGIVHYDWDWV